MQIFLRYLIISVFIFAVISCGKDDTSLSTTEEGQPPSNFTISIDSGFTSATVSWAVETGLNNQNLRYAVFIDDKLVKSDISTASFVIFNLEMARSYQLKVVATNDFGEAIQEMSFSTLDPRGNLLLSKLDGGGNDTIIYDYDTRGNLISREYDREKRRTTLDYDSNRNLINETILGDFTRTETDFIYQNNVLTQVNVKYISDYPFSHDYYYLNQDSYSLEIRSQDHLTGELIVRNYDISLNRDAGQNIINFKMTNIDNQEVIEFQFAYANENLVQVVNVNNGDTWDTLYDEMESYKTFDSFRHNNFPLVVGLPFTVSGSGYPFDFIPEFASYRNKNNPIEIKLNDVTIETVNYEYNEFGYPIKIISSSAPNNPWDLTYTLPENP